VLEDGADVCNSESDSENEDHGDELTGCYVGIPLDDQGNPLSASYKLSEQQAAALRWEAQQSRGFAVSTTQTFVTGTQIPTTHSLPLREEKLTPMNPDDKPNSTTRGQKRAQATASRSAQKANVRGPPAPSRFERAGELTQGKSGMTTRSQVKGNEGDQGASTELVPVKRAPKKKSTKNASGAGGLRAVVGSG
jgi:hypothetical protein